jgi:hypothetical protein
MFARTRRAEHGEASQKRLLTEANKRTRAQYEDKTQCMVFLAAK